MDNSIILTEEGLAKLKAELEQLKKTRRPQIAERIRIAKDWGDLSENAEYHEAKEEQAFVEGRILELEHTIKVATVVETASTLEQVGVGSEVTVDGDSGSKTYRIVGATEADPTHGKISLESPLGKSLMGKSIGDSVEIKTPTKSIRYQISKIS